MILHRGRKIRGTTSFCLMLTHKTSSGYKHNPRALTGAPDTVYFVSTGGSESVFRRNAFGCLAPPGNSLNIQTIATTFNSS